MQPLNKRSLHTKALSWSEVDSNWTNIENAITAIEAPSFVSSSLGFTPLSTTGTATWTSEGVL